MLQPQHNIALKSVDKKVQGGLINKYVFGNDGWITAKTAKEV